MPDAELRALRRAALLLVALSALRWAHSRSAGTASPPAEDVVEEHAAATRQSATDQEGRDRPLADGERIDPNVASPAALDRLPGVGASKARAIAEARDGGLEFRSVDDLLRVPGIGPALVERMRPHLSLGAAGAGRSRSRRPRGGGASDRPSRAPSSAGPAGRLPLDLNRATRDELMTLPGVGPVTADRIITARRERPFDSVDELTRVSGIGPATVGRLRGLATVAGRGG